MKESSGIEIGSKYNPKEIEKDWYSVWEKDQYFSWKHESKKNSQEGYSMVIPPPNVTGSLHLGHALNHTLQDILARYHRLKGKKVLWLPGTDHAGIATQNVVEKQLREVNQDRKSLGRKAFEEKVWAWKEKSGGTITYQQRQLGESVDWNYERFTMDDGLSKIVKKSFIQLYNEGLIYRGERMINWCPKDETALSNIEVEYREVNGKLYTFQYPLEGGDYLPVATTRPETMLGDMALAVNPEDKRYKGYIGKKAVVPFIGREIPIIADAYVDKDYGTGVVKVTPAHDPNDFEMAQRHDLEFLNVMTSSARIAAEGGKFEGQSREECRKNILRELEENGQLIETKDIKHSVGHSYRSGAIIEPRLSLQWFVNVKPMAEKAIKVVKDGDTVFYPERWSNTYFEWLNNIQDWCISRQLWWGHRIPAYYCQSCDHMMVADEAPGSCLNCGSKELEQDQDVLDTWFSSGMWPYSTMMDPGPGSDFSIPGKTEELDTFYPTSVLITGFDIIFFWVARMMMFGLHFTKQVPFKHVYIHGLVRDADRQKMSKSKGNVVDPLEKMTEYGTDAFRFFLISILPEGKDIIFDESRLNGYRAFCNKIWNTARFILMNGGQPSESPSPSTEADHWILSRYAEALANIESALASYRFADYAQACYDFLWKDFCDSYVEIAKVQLATEDDKENTLNNLYFLFNNTLKMLHPIIPFITEELFQFFKGENDDLLVTNHWSQEASFNRDHAQSFEKTLNAIYQVRKLRADLKVPPSEKLNAFLKSKNLDEANQRVIVNLCKLENLIESDDLPENSIKVLTGIGEIGIDALNFIDVEAERSRIQKEIQFISKGFEAVEKKLSNQKFKDNAPKDLVDAELKKHQEYSEKLERLRELENSLNA